MHFSTLFTPLLLSTSVFAAPGLNAVRADQSINAANAILGTLDGTTISAADLALFPELAGAFQYASTALGCKWWKCGAVVLKAPCIISAIASLDIEAALNCASKKSMCACGDCVSELGDFLSGANICT